MVFLKNITRLNSQQNIVWLNHLLIGILVSYRNYRKKIGFHGHISHNSIVGIEDPSKSVYISSRGVKSKTNGVINASHSKGKGPSQAELFDYKYKLIYHHGNMLTIKEWLHKRKQAIENNAK